VKLTNQLQLVPRSIKVRSIHPFPHTSSWRSAYLVKHRDSFTFYIKHHTETVSTSVKGPVTTHQTPAYVSPKQDRLKETYMYMHETLVQESGRKDDVTEQQAEAI
jgi:hypothetical protein